MSSKSPSPQSRRAKPSSTKSVGSRPRLARSYTAGISFLRARSPVTPNTTSAHGSGTRGSRRSRGSRSAFLGPSSAPSRTLTSRPSSRRVSGGGREQLPQPASAVGEVQAYDGAFATLDRQQVAERLRQLQPPERERLPGYVEVGGVRAGDLQERPHLRAALVELPGRMQEPRRPPEGDGVCEPRGERAAQLRSVSIGDPVEVGHDGEVTAVR